MRGDIVTVVQGLTRVREEIMIVGKTESIIGATREIKIINIGKVTIAEIIHRVIEEKNEMIVVTDFYFDQSIN